MFTCKRCKKNSSTLKKSQNFCSKSCANSRSWSDEDKLKKSIAAKNSQKVIETNRRISKGKHIEKNCPCGKTFDTIPCLKKKYCSKTCVYKYGKFGGLRLNSGRGKSGYYKGIYCNSTYELCWVIYQIDKNIQFERFQGSLSNDEITYYPDFLVGDNKIIEIKGFEDPKIVAKKTELALSKGFQVEVLYKEDLKSVFEYVKLQYKTNKFYELYDNFKPKFEYCCRLCKSLFHREKKSKKQNVFCSRSCSMKYNGAL